MNIYPFNSDQVVLKKDNKVVIEDEEGALQAFMMLDKELVDQGIMGLDYINKHRFNSIYSQINFFSPVCDIPEMTPAVNSVYRKALNNLMEEGISPDEYVQKRKDAHEKYLGELEDVGYTHVIFGYTHGDDGDPEEIMLSCESLEEEILNLK